MANPIRVTSNLLVSPQLTVADVDGLSAVGVKAIICNRPDGEASSQPASADIRQAAEASGIAFTYMPVTKNLGFEGNAPQQFAKILEEAGGEVVAYCASGRRSACMWALSQVEQLGADEIIRTAAQAGYDVAALRPRLEQAPGDATGPAVAAAAVAARKPGFFSRLFGRA